jgi:hypothetical protein
MKRPRASTMLSVRESVPRIIRHLGNRPQGQSNRPQEPRPYAGARYPSSPRTRAGAGPRHVVGGHGGGRLAEAAGQQGIQRVAPWCARPRQALLDNVAQRRMSNFLGAASVWQEVTSVRQAASVCNVTPPVVRRWLSLGLITEPPWTLQQLHQVRELTDPDGRRHGPQAAHGTLTPWLEGCECDPMPGSAERCSSGTLSTQGTSAAPNRGAKAVPGRYLCRPIVPDGAPRPRPDA